MKKILFVMAMMASALTSHAFDFDGISLNLPYVKVSQEIAKRGYYFDAEKNCLRGFCQGTEIYLNINYKDVSKRGMLAQLIVEVPIKTQGQTLSDVVMLLNVIYHQIDHTENSYTYAVDNDGTQLVVSQQGSSYLLTYNTPYYKKK